MLIIDNVLELGYLEFVTMLTGKLTYVPGYGSEYMTRHDALAVD